MGMLYFDTPVPCRQTTKNGNAQSPWKDEGGHEDNTRMKAGSQEIYYVFAAGDAQAVPKTKKKH